VPRKADLLGTRAARERAGRPVIDAPRRTATEGFVRSVGLTSGGDRPAGGHPWDIPAVRALAGGVDLSAGVTFLIGENGSGKSTLLEGLAVALGMNAEGGGRNVQFSTRASHSALGDHLRLVRGVRRPRTDFFLRAESVFTVATYIEELPAMGGDPLEPYGGRSLHEQSHGESFLAIALNRFGPDGLYLLDEPESALSPQNQLTLLRRMHELVADGSQFVVATHSPLLLAYPGALILRCDADGLTPVGFDDAEPVSLVRGFLADPQRYLHHLLGGPA
jgi:predicted ATPase